MSLNIKAAVITASDTRKESDDLSGDTLVTLLSDLGAELVEREIVSDDFDELRQTLYTMSEREDLNLILTTGGTGLAERDNTPEATLAVIEREVPGIAETMRRETLKQTKFAILSRAVAGIRNGTLIINLPGSPKGVRECFEVVKEILPHAIEQISGDTEH